MAEITRLNADELEAIRKRVEKLSKGSIIRDISVLPVNNKVVFEDVPKLLAEIERLRGVLEDISEINEYYSGDTAREALEHVGNL